MTQGKAPEWAIEQAASINLVLPYMHVQQEIALAISQAYEWGQESMRERAAGVSDKRAKMAAQVNQAAAVALLIALPDAIRSLPIEQGGGE